MTNIRHLKLVGLAAIALVGISGVSNPVSADIGDCASGKYCLYRDYTYFGGKVDSSVKINALSSYGFDNLASSIINARAYRVFFYEKDNQVGPGTLCKSAYGIESNLNYVGMNDKISSTNTGNTYATCP